MTICRQNGTFSQRTSITRRGLLRMPGNLRFPLIPRNLDGTIHTDMSLVSPEPLARSSVRCLDHDRFHLEAANFTEWG